MSVDAELTQNGVLHSFAKYVSTWADVLIRGPLSPVSRNTWKRRGYQAPALFLVQSGVLFGLSTTGVLILENSRAASEGGYERILPIQVAFAVAGLLPLIVAFPTVVIVGRLLWPRISLVRVWLVACYTSSLLILQPIALLVWGNLLDLIDAQVGVTDGVRFIPILVLGLATPIWFFVACAAVHRRSILLFTGLCVVGMLGIQSIPVFGVYVLEPSARGDPQILLNSHKGEGPVLLAASSTEASGAPAWKRSIQTGSGDTLLVRIVYNNLSEYVARDVRVSLEFVILPFEPTSFVVIGYVSCSNCSRDAVGVVRVLVQVPQANNYSITPVALAWYDFSGNEKGRLPTDQVDDDIIWPSQILLGDVETGRKNAGQIVVRFVFKGR